MENDNKFASPYYIYTSLLNRIQNQTDNSLVDVACGHGRYSIIAEILDFKVQGIDGRNTRVPFFYPNIDWVIQNVDDIKFDHDIVLLSGILYHLDLQTQTNMINRINESRCKFILLNTHTVKIENEEVKNTGFTGLLSAPEYLDGYYGCKYYEGQNRENNPMASIQNEYSFWHTEESLALLFNQFNVIKINNEIADNRYFYLLERR